MFCKPHGPQARVVFRWDLPRSIRESILPGMQSRPWDLGFCNTHAIKDSLEASAKRIGGEGDQEQLECTQLHMP